MSQQKIVAIIPARYNSNRYPGKPLVVLLGKPMIIWVAELTSIALGKENWAEGASTIAIGEKAHAVGGGSVAMGKESIAWGTTNFTAGYQTVAGDINATQGTAGSATAIGHGTFAQGRSSFAANKYTTANNQASTSLGVGTISDNFGGVTPSPTTSFNTINDRSSISL